MKNLVLIESILWYLRSREYRLLILISQMCPWLLNNVDWGWISEHETLSEEFISKFRDKVFWHLISEYQTLSEEFIAKFQDKVDWYWISWSQTLSEEFISKFQDRVNWKNWTPSSRSVSSS